MRKSESSQEDSLFWAFSMKQLNMPVKERIVYLAVSLEFHPADQKNRNILYRLKESSNTFLFFFLSEIIHKRFLLLNVTIYQSFAPSITFHDIQCQKKVLPVIQPHFQLSSSDAEKSRRLMACKNKYNATIGYNSCESLAVQIIT
jgi:hypothetical protein